MAVSDMTSYPRNKAVRLSASTCVRTCAGAILQAIETTASCPKYKSPLTASCCIWPCARGCRGAFGQ